MNILQGKAVNLAVSMAPSMEAARGMCEEYGYEFADVGGLPTMRNANRTLAIVHPLMSAPALAGEYEQDEIPLTLSSFDFLRTPINAHLQLMN